MIKNLYSYASRHKNIILFLTVLFLFFFLYFRNSAGIYPGLLDEFYYNQSARLLPLSDARYGNYLYYFIYRLTNFCGNGFFSCVYFLNTFFYTLAFFPIYLILKRFGCASSLAYLVAIYAILEPFNYWTAFFMPESLAFFLFWILIWILFKKNHSSERFYWIGVGSILGLAGLIKIHAIFLTPAIIFYIVLKELKNKADLFEISQKITLLFISLVLVKFGLGYLIAGERGLSFFGSYGNFGGVVEHAVGISKNINISKSVLDPKYAPLSLLQRDGVNALLINILPLFLFFGPSIAIVLYEFFQAVSSFFKNRQRQISDQTKIYILTLLIILTLITGITAYQLIQIASGDGNAELYWRYYEYSFPLLYICAAITLASTENELNRFLWKRCLIGILVLSIALWSITLGFGNGFIGVNTNSKIYYSISLISIITTFLWVLNAKVGIKAFIFLLAPLVIVSSNIAIYKTYKSTRFSPNESSVGMYLNSRLSAEDLKKLVIVQDTHLTQTVPLLYLNQAPLTMIGIPPDQYRYNLDDLPAGKDWIILMGNHELTGNKLMQTHMDYMSFGGVTIFGGHGEIFLDFKNSEWVGQINSITGLYHPPEPWGAWSISKEIKFEFSKPLPRKFDLTISARAFGPNRKKEFSLRLGDKLTKFRVDSFPQFKNISLTFDNQHKLNRFEILIPEPTPPSAYQHSEDNRALGIGLQYLKISW